MKAIRIRLKAPVRVGGLKGFESYDDTVHSDTIFGAIANSVAYLNLDFEDFIQRVKENEILISSALPFKDDLWLPAPMIKPRVRGLEREFLKKYKNCFVRKQIFEKILAGEEIDVTEEQEINNMLAKSEKFFVYTDIASVALDRQTASTNLYQYTVLSPKNCELCVLVDSSDFAFTQYLKPAFKLLADEGIGGNRNIGLGHFDFQIDDLNLRAPKSEFFTTLSLSIVDKRNLVSYDITKRGGYVFSRSGKNVRKPLFFMLREGSVVRNDMGKLIDLESYGKYSEELGHRVFVYAKVFPASISSDYFGR